MQEKVEAFSTLCQLLEARDQDGYRKRTDGREEGEFSVLPRQISVDALMKKEYEQGNFMVQGEALEKEAGRIFQNLPGQVPQLRKLLTFLIREMMRNTPEHGKSREFWFCGRGSSQEGWVEAACLDQGIGIFRSLTGNLTHRAYIHDDREALQWAVKAGISVAFSPSSKQRSDDEWANSGFGLYMVSQICRKTGGSFQLLSGTACLTMDAHQIQEGRGDFPGTGVAVRIPYREIQDAQKLISETAMEGEIMAREIRTAFRQASKPSRGLTI